MKKRAKRTILTGIIHIQSTFNNTIVTVTDFNGKTISWASSGTANFRGSRKGTPFAAQKAAEQATLKARDFFGLRQANVIVKGAGSGREPAIRAIHQNGVRIVSILDATGIPYNGCRPPKRRRV